MAEGASLDVPEQTSGITPTDLDQTVEAVIDAVLRGQHRARAYSSRCIAALRGGASDEEIEQWRRDYPFRDEREFMREEVALALAASAEHTHRGEPNTEAASETAVLEFAGHRVHSVAQGIEAVISHTVSPVVGKIRLDDADGVATGADGLPEAFGRAAGAVVDELAQVLVEVAYLEIASERHLAIVGTVPGRVSVPAQWRAEAERRARPFLDALRAAAGNPICAAADLASDADACHRDASSREVEVPSSVASDSSAPFEVSSLAELDWLPKGSEYRHGSDDHQRVWVKDAYDLWFPIDHFDDPRRVGVSSNGLPLPGLAQVKPVH